MLNESSYIVDIFNENFLINTFIVSNMSPRKHFLTCLEPWLQYLRVHTGCFNDGLARARCLFQKRPKDKPYTQLNVKKICDTVTICHKILFETGPRPSALRAHGKRNLSAF